MSSKKQRRIEAFGYRMLMPKEVVVPIENQEGCHVYQDPSFQEDLSDSSWKYIKKHPHFFYLRLKANKVPEGILIPLDAETLKLQRRMRYSELMAILKTDNDKNYLEDDLLRKEINVYQGYPINTTYRDQDHLFTHSVSAIEYAQDIQRWIKIVHENQHHNAKL